MYLSSNFPKYSQEVKSFVRKIQFSSCRNDRENYRNVHKSTVSQSLNSDQKWWKQKIVIQYCPFIYTCRKGKKNPLYLHFHKNRF